MRHHQLSMLGIFHQTGEGADAAEEVGAVGMEFGGKRSWMDKSELDSSTNRFVHLVSECQHGGRVGARAAREGDELGGLRGWGLEGVYPQKHWQLVGGVASSSLP